MTTDRPDVKKGSEKLISKFRRILRREGVGGIVGRVRHTPLSVLRRTAPSPLPQLGGPVAIRDHGQPALTAALREVLHTSGIKTDPKGQVVWHVGIPATALGRQDIVLVAGAVPHDELAGLANAGLVLDHARDRLVYWASPRSGGLNYLAYCRPDMACDGLDFTVSIKRALLLLGYISPDAIDYKSAFKRIRGDIPALCLSLPEHPNRTGAFDENNPLGIPRVAGIRLMPGWSGAALSYQRIALAAQQLGYNEILVCQDDAEFPEGFSAKFDRALSFWRASGADAFSGLVTDVDDDFEILSVDDTAGDRFVTLQKNIGLVFMIFGKTAIDHLANWQGPAYPGQTIDRYFGDAGELRIVTRLPYLVRHRSGLNSSIWNFRNDRYETLINYSENRLIRMAKAHDSEAIK